MKKPRVVVVGDLNVDILLFMPQKPLEDTSIAVSNAKIMPGGVAVNISTNLSCLGVEPIVIGAVGSDVMGEYLLRNLRKNRISVDRIKVIDNETTGFMVILKESPADWMPWNYLSNR